MEPRITASNFRLSVSYSDLLLIEPSLFLPSSIKKESLSLTLLLQSLFTKQNSQTSIAPPWQTNPNTMHIFHRFLILLSTMAFLAQCTPINNLIPRGICYSGTFARVAPPAPLPPVDINITSNIQNANDITLVPWTEGTGTPGHRWRWRAAGTRGGPIVEMQLYGWYGAHVELRMTAPRTANRPAIAVTPNENVNGGGSDGWGEVLCLNAMNFQRGDMTYVLHVSIGKFLSFFLFLARRSKLYIYKQKTKYKY